MLQIALAFLAGMLTLAAPCILPLLPLLLGVSVGQTSRTRPLFIVIGFVFVFTLASLTLSYFARHVGLDPNIFRLIAIFSLAIFGFFMIWPDPFEYLMARTQKFFLSAGAWGYRLGKGNIGGLLFGMTLGLVWTPCAGPVLGSILTLIAFQKEFAAAGILLCAYALGAGVPMLGIAYGGQIITQRIVGIAKYARIIQKIFGFIIIVLAIAFYFNVDTILYSSFFKNYPVTIPKL